MLIYSERHSNQMIKLIPLADDKYVTSYARIYV